MPSRSNRREHRYYPYSLILDYASAVEEPDLEVTCIALITSNSIHQIKLWKANNQTLYNVLKKKYSQFCPPKPKKKYRPPTPCQGWLENLEEQGFRFHEGVEVLPPYERICSSPQFRIQNLQHWI